MSLTRSAVIAVGLTIVAGLNLLQAAAIDSPSGVIRGSESTAAGVDGPVYRPLELQSLFSDAPGHDSAQLLIPRPEATITELPSVPTLPEIPDASTGDFDTLTPSLKSGEVVTTPFRNKGAPGDRVQITDPLQDGLDKGGQRRNFDQMMRAPYSVYRSEQDTIAWIPTSGEHLNWLDWQSDPFLAMDASHGLTGGINFHWIGGPVSPDVPPRVYDMSVGYQVRKSLSEQFSFDAAVSVGVFSDFEGSAREGVRFPGHAVGMFHLNRNADLIFGIDYLDRDDLHVLPVIGLSLRDLIFDQVRWDLVFPRPRIDFQLSTRRRIYLAGQLGGGTWDMEYPDKSGDVLTYRDYRLLLGLESADKDGSLSAWELGYVCGRHLEFRNQPAGLDFGDAFVIQWVSRR